jgi:hypothetical protein
MLKNEERSHHVTENKGSRFGTNPKAKPKLAGTKPIMAGTKPKLAGTKPYSWSIGSERVNAVRIIDED